MPQVGQHCAALQAFQLAVVYAPQHGVNPGVPPRITPRLPEFESLRARQDLPHLLDGAHLYFVHIDHHPLMMIDPPLRPAARQPDNRRFPASPGSFLVGITPASPGSHLVGQDWPCTSAPWLAYPYLEEL